MRSFYVEHERPAASSAILKTWPSFMKPRRVFEIFANDWPTYYFTLGRGKPRAAISELWFTYRGRVLGQFDVTEVAKNNGTNIPRLRRIDGGESEWQIKWDAWVAICAPPMHWLKERLYHDSFRGWRYFDINTYRGKPESRFRH